MAPAWPPDGLTAGQALTGRVDIVEGRSCPNREAVRRQGTAGEGSTGCRRSNAHNAYPVIRRDTRDRSGSYGAQKDRLLLVQYETLTADPAKTMHAIYALLGEPGFEHDFDHIDYDVTDFDERAGTPGLHTVAATVKAEPRDTVLPPDVFNRFIHDAFWRDPQRIPDGLRVV
jgi:hypothetical protein